MDLAFEIARKLRLSADSGRKTSVSVTIATAGVALAIAVMLFTIAVTAGFKSEIRDTITGFDGDMSVVSVGGDPDEKLLGGQLAHRVSDIVREYDANATLSGRVTVPAMLKTRSDFEAIMLRGYTPGSDVRFLQSMIVEGDRSVVDSLFSGCGEDIIVISTVEATRLGLSAGDRINTVFFDTSGNIRIRNPRVEALFRSNFPSYDTSVGFASKPFLDEVTGRGADEWDELVVDGIDFDRWTDVADDLRMRLWQEYVSGTTPVYMGVECVLDSSAQFFNWLELLDTNVVVIIVLMSLIGLFTLTAALFILILERTRMIGTFKTMGASNTFLRKVFVLLVGRIVVRGLFWGDLIAVAVILVQSVTHALPLDPDAYFISFVPVKLSLPAFVGVNLAALGAALLAMIIPSALITRFSPAKVLRFE